MNYLLGIDISTTGAKALITDPSGCVLGTASTEYPLSTPQPLWSEQDPQDWWNAIVNSIRNVLKFTGVSSEDIISIGLTGQMHGLTLLDKAGQVLRPAILWNDQRTAAECDEIRSIVGESTFISISGNNALTGFTAPKILWVRNHEPEIYNRIAHILLPKDYVRYQLTGEYAIDCADGSGTVLFDLKQRNWSKELISALSIDPSWLPKAFEGTQITGVITAEAALLTGLKAGTPVVGGGGDQAAQAVGVGAVDPGIVALTLGTSGVVFAATDEPFIEPNGRMHAFCHALPNRWHLMGVMLSAAGSLKWYRDTFSPGTDYDSLLAPITEIVIGSEGLYFLPYLSGERTPYPDPYARGAFVGLTLRHTFAHCTRALIEGISFGLKDSFELMKSVGVSDIKQVRISGGGSRSPIWRQILADIFDVELVTVNTSEGAAFGAALLAGVGTGVWQTAHDACSQTISLTGNTSPILTNVLQYKDHYAMYNSLYPTLKDTFHRM